MENQANESSPTRPIAVDEKEVQFFSEQAEIWWDTKGGFSGLHSMNNLRVPFIIDSVIASKSIKQDVLDPEKPLEGIQMLEVGCGGGILTEALAKKGCEITGLDATSELIELAKFHANLDSTLSNITYLYTTIEEHAQQFSGKYDVVVCSEVLEHVTEREQLLDACVKCLKPGGSIIVTTLNKTLMSWWMGIVMSEYILRYTKRGTHEWSKFISPEEVSSILKKYGCSTESVRGMKFHLFVHPKKWYWSEDTSVNYSLHAVKDTN